MAVACIGARRPTEVAPYGGFRLPNDEGPANAGPSRSRQRACVAQPQIAFLSVETEITPPGPCFHAYHEPFCATTQ
jgi:hypothetical protein